MNKSKLTPAMERAILDKWAHGWAVFRIRKHLTEAFGQAGKDITPSIVYNLLTKARKRGDKRATRRHTDMVVSAS